MKTSPRVLSRWMLPAAVVIAGLASAQAPPPIAPPAAPQAAPSTAPAPPADAPRVPRTLDVPDNALVAAGTAPDLDLLYTGDVIGFIEPCG